MSKKHELSSQQYTRFYETVKSHHYPVYETEYIPAHKDPRSFSNPRSISGLLGRVTELVLSGMQTHNEIYIFLNISYTVQNDKHAAMLRVSRDNNTTLTLSFFDPNGTLWYVNKKGVLTQTNAEVNLAALFTQLGQNIKAVSNFKVVNFEEVMKDNINVLKGPGVCVVLTLYFFLLCMTYGYNDARVYLHEYIVPIMRDNDQSSANALVTQMVIIIKDIKHYLRDVNLKEVIKLVE